MHYDFINLQKAPRLPIFYYLQRGTELSTARLPLTYPFYVYTNVEKTTDILT